MTYFSIYMFADILKRRIRNIFPTIQTSEVVFRGVIERQLRKLHAKSCDYLLKGDFLQVLPLN